MSLPPPDAKAFLLKLPFPPSLWLPREALQPLKPLGPLGRPLRAHPGTGIIIILIFLEFLNDSEHAAEVRNHDKSRRGGIEP